MKRRVFLCLCLWSLVGSAVGKTVDVYVAEGQTIILRPKFQDPIKSIEWKWNRNLLAEWDGKKVTRYDERATLNVSTGALELVRAVAADALRFSLSLNDEMQDDAFAVKLIDFVPQPEVHPVPLACSDEFESCALHCGGNTSGAEPVSFFWRSEPAKEMAGGRKLSIDRTDAVIRRFFCVMENPLGRKESGAFENPFYRDRPDSGFGPGEIAAVIVGVVLTPAGMLLGYFLYRKHRETQTRPTYEAASVNRGGCHGDTETVTRDVESKDWDVSVDRSV